MTTVSGFEVLGKRRKAILDKINALYPITRGSVVELRRPCTYPNCRKCKSGEKHPAMYLSVNKAGRTHITYLPKYAVKPVSKAVANHKKAKELLDVLCEIDLNILLSRLKQEHKG